MKCPKCGFVGFPGIAQCKKCGHRFAPEPPAAKPSEASSAVPNAGPLRPESPRAGGENGRPDLPSAGTTSPELPSQESVRPEASAEAFSPSPPIDELREEISGRVEDFRRKRAGMRKKFDPGSSLDLEFGPADDDEETFEEPEGVTGSEARQVDAELNRPEEGPLLESSPIEKSGDEIRVLTSAAVEAGEANLEGPKAESEPVEIVVEPSSRRPAEEGDMVAPLGLRFVAGVADSVILVVGGALFGTILWAAGGHLTPNPLNAGVLGFLAVLTLMVYFGVFTALGGGTPGLLWMNLQVRSQYGRSPSTAESFWRAFGYLISLASLLLGFIWALLDSEKMTWHDRISGTFIAPLQ